MNDIMSEAYFVTGIGTDIGKSWATGWLANRLSAEGKSVITQKFIQTGNHDMSEDILLHRKIMNIPLTPEDEAHITAPVIFSYPASPHLAARIDNREIPFDKIDEATETLRKRYDTVLIEGAGGLMVPLCGDYLTIDYIAERRLPVVLVTNGRLGSISDTLLALRAIKDYGIALHSVVYNPYFDSTDAIVSADSREYMRDYVSRHFPEAQWMEMEK